jgi:hypothetical protein
MILIDKETGVEYKVNSKGDFEWCTYRTGKVYERRVGFGLIDKMDSGLTTRQESCDTHRAFCFLEPLEKNHMPEILLGDYIISAVDHSGSYVFSESIAKHLALNHIKEIYRAGVKIWQGKS